MQPLRAWQASRTQHVSASTSPDKSDHSTYPFTNFESQSEPASIWAKQGRRDMMASFALAAAANNRAAVAKDAVYNPYEDRNAVPTDLPPAGDYTRYDKVITKKRPSSEEKKQASGPPGSVEIQPLLVPAVVAFSALVTAAVPALLSPGQTAFEAQRAGGGSKAGKGKLKTRRGLIKNQEPPKRKFFR